VASRRIELAILAQHGLKSHLQYAKYIQDEEEQSHLKAHHMDATSLKVRRLQSVYTRSLCAHSHLVCCVRVACSSERCLEGEGRKGQAGLSAWRGRHHGRSCLFCEH
jgi:hypothetical protein